MSSEKKTAVKKKKRADARKATPTIIWALLTRELVSDRSTGAASAINIVEDIYLPKHVFTNSEEMNIVDIGHPLCLALTLDWKWPKEVKTKNPIELQLDWYAPSGNSFFSDGHEKPIGRPKHGNRTHVEVKLSNLPIEEEGIYYVDVLLNGKSGAKYPVRIRSMSDLEST